MRAKPIECIGTAPLPAVAAFCARARAVNFAPNASPRACAAASPTNAAAASTPSLDSALSSAPRQSTITGPAVS